MVVFWKFKGLLSFNYYEYFILIKKGEYEEFYLR